VRFVEFVELVVRLVVFVELCRGVEMLSASECGSYWLRKSEHYRVCLFGKGDGLASHLGRISVASCYRNRDKLRPCEPPWPVCDLTLFGKELCRGAKF